LVRFWAWSDAYVCVAWNRYMASKPKWTLRMVSSKIMWIS